jgi:hypothetical protein
MPALTAERQTVQPAREAPRERVTNDERPLLVAQGPLPVQALASPARTALTHREAARTGEHEESTPVVEVTIGRVDVRAVTPPAPQRQEPAKPRCMSLDEYLSRRPGSSA